MKRILLIFLSSLFLLIFPNAIFSQAPTLGSTRSFSVFTAVGAFSNDGATHIIGDIGTNAGLFTGFPPGTVIGQTHVADGTSSQAATDVAIAYSSFPTGGAVLGVTLGNAQVIMPGTYQIGAAATLNGVLTFTGSATDYFFIKIDGALATNPNSSVMITGGASACNVFWQINGAFALGTNSSFQGTVIAGGAITLNIGSSLFGRALTTAGAINLHTTNVTIPPPPLATISASGPVILCQGGSVTLTASIGASYLWSNGATSRSITVSAAGSYSVTVTDACGTNTSAATVVTVNPVPTATISANGPLTFCQGGSVVLTASGGSTYLWSNGATTSSITVSATGSYSVISTSAGCSTTSAAVAVTVNLNPTPSISANGAVTFCQGGSVILTASGGSSYLWSNGATTTSITVSTSGSYNVVATNAAGCKGTSATTLVTVNPNPTANISANGPLTFCQGGSVILTASLGSGYLWSTGATTQSITVTTSGNYTVRVTNANGCQTTSAATSVTVNPSAIPTISANGPITFCAGGSVILTSSAASGYLWSTGATTQSITVSAAGSYSVTTTGTCAGTSVATVVTITPSAIPIITANGPLTFCPGGSVVLTSSGASGYLWSTGATTQSITVTAAGSYTVTTTGACAGTSTATVVTISAGAVPTISANGPLTFCFGGSVILTSSPSSGYLWSTGATTQSITVTASGNYSVTTSGTCAGTSVSTTVTVIPILIPTITANGPLIFCQGGSVILTSSASSGYLWSTGATTQSITVTAAGNYSVTTTANCGGTSTSVAVTVSPSVIPTISANGPITFCPSGSVILTSSAASGYLWSTGATTQSIIVTAGGTYTVTTAGICGGTSAPTVITINPSAIPSISASGPLTFCPSGSVELTSSGASGYLWSTGATTQSITVTTAGSYSVTTTGACAGTSAATVVTISPSAIPTITVIGPLTFCQGGSVILSASSASGYLWSTGATTQSITVSAAGNYTVTTSGSCGGTSAAIAVSVIPTAIPTISANGPLSFCPGGNVTLSASSSTGYLWSTGATSQSITVSAAGNYSVTATGICGLTSATVIVSLNNSDKPTISASGPLSFCIGDNVILTSSAANSYLWSTGATTQSITVTTAGSYTVSTSGICSGTSAVALVILTPIEIPTITVAGSTNFCQGDSIILTASAANGYLWSSGATTRSITVKTSGDYSVTTSGFCGNTSAKIKAIVTASNTPTMVPHGLVSICEGDSVTLTASPSSGYLWSTNDTTRSIKVKASGVYTVTTPGICAGVSAITTVEMNTALIPVITASGPIKFCLGDSVILTSSLDNGNVWSTGDTTRSIIVKASGNYSVFSPGICGDTSAIVVVTASSIKIPTITASGPLSFCLGDSVILTASDGSFYRWNFSGNKQSIVVKESGSFWVRVLNECGYNYSAVKYVTVNPLPNCTIIATSTLCDLGSTRLCATSTNGKYLWNTGDTTQCINITALGTYSVTVTSAQGCSSSCSKTITAFQSPNCTITGDTTICLEKTAVLSAPGGNNTYKWNTGATSQSITIAAAGTYTVTVTNSNGCSSTCSKTVKTVIVPACIIMGKVNLCPMEMTELKGPMGATTYTWSNGATDGWIGVQDSGVYTLTVTYANSCPQRCSVKVTIMNCMGGADFTILKPSFNDIIQQKTSIRNTPKADEIHQFGLPGVGKFEDRALPNPFVHSTLIEFSSTMNNNKIKVEVYNLQGQKVASLFEGIVSKNERKQVRFEAAGLTEGIYYYRISDGIITTSKKLVLMKN